MNKTIWDYNTRLRKSTKYVRQGDIILEMKKIQKKKKIFALILENDIFFGTSSSILGGNVLFTGSC